jgi:hypothetical protein
MGHGWNTVMEARIVPGILIALVSAVLVGIGTTNPASPTSSESDPAGFSLLAEDSSSNLNTTSAEAPSRLEPPPPAPLARETERPLPPPPPALEEEPPAVWQVETPSPVVLPSEPAPAPVEFVRVPPKPLPPEVLTVSAESATPSAIGPSQPGDCTMKYSSKPLFPVLLAAFLAAGPHQGQAADPPADPSKEKVILDRLKEIQESIVGLGKQVDNLKTETDVKIQKALEKTNGDIADLKGKVDRLTTDMDALRKALGTPTVSGYGPTNKDLEEVRKQLTSVEQSLKAIRDQLASSRMSGFGPEPTLGRLVLKNDYPQDMQFVINSTVYTLRPFEDRELKLPAGKFTFRIPAVPGYQVARERTLGTERPHEIRIFPLQ